MIKTLILLFFLAGFGITTNVHSDTLKAQRIASLYEEADFVGFVKILSGEFKEYSGAVYKARVLKILKGNPIETEIYLGPFSGYGIGSEYLLFSRKTGQTLATHWPQDRQSRDSLSFPANAEYFSIMFEGFGMMSIQYVVRLDGNAVEIPTHIKLPPELKEKIKRSDNKEWVGKDDIAKYLESFGKAH